VDTDRAKVVAKDGVMVVAMETVAAVARGKVVDMEAVAVVAEAKVVDMEAVAAVAEGADDAAPDVAQGVIPPSQLRHAARPVKGENRYS
jgi:hypothetical protein